MTMYHFGLLSLFLVAACEPVEVTSVAPPAAVTEGASLAASAVPATVVEVYLCGPELRLVAEFRAQSVWLFLPERSLLLNQVAAASGARYQGDGVSLWSKGGRALLEIDGVSQPECMADSRQAPWERAKLAGADFRALGQEPAWVLELYPERVVLLLNYGQTRIETPAAAVEEDRVAGISRYDIETEANRLTIELRSQPCLDSMSGEQFATSVQLEVNGRQLKGCGRPLH